MVCGSYNIVWRRAGLREEALNDFEAHKCSSSIHGGMLEPVVLFLFYYIQKYFLVPKTFKSIIIYPASFQPD